MEKITNCYTHDYENDTSVEYVNTGAYSQLTCSFTSEDEDYGTETIHSLVAKPPKKLEQMAFEMAKDIGKHLDSLDNHHLKSVYTEEERKFMKLYGDYGTTTLYAVEHVLNDIAKDSVINSNGHEFMVGTIRECATELIRRFTNKEIRCAYVAIDWDEEVPHRVDGASRWYKVVRVDLPFDNNDNEMLLMIGYCGGGDVETAYCLDITESNDPWFHASVVKMLKDSTDALSIDTKRYVEFIGVNDEHSYELDKEGK